MDATRLLCVPQTCLLLSPNTSCDPEINCKQMQKTVSHRSVIGQICGSGLCLKVGNYFCTAPEVFIHLL